MTNTNKIMIEKTTLNRLKDQEREIRKNLIIDAAEQVFSTKPYAKVSMREIAKEAGIAVSTIYTYFPNQESLFVEAAMKETNTLIDGLVKLIKSYPDEKNLETIITEIIDSFIEFVSYRDSYFRMMVVFMTHGQLNIESLKMLNDTMRRGLNMFDILFDEINYKGNTRLFSRFFFAALNGILVTYRKLPGRDEDEVIRHMKEVGSVMKTMIVNMENRSNE